MAGLQFTSMRTAVAAATLCATVIHPAAAADAQDYSPAEKLIFMSDQLHNVKPPTTLHYRFSRTGTLESPFEDSASVALKAQPDGSCCAASGEFLSGANKTPAPEIENARANPVILYFLEHDISDMHRWSKGQQNYFRKRVRLAIYNGAQVKDVSLKYDGKPIAAQQVDITPYLDDPARSRYDKYARKRYTFFLSDSVPGGLYGIRTVMSAESDSAPPLVVDSLFVEGADPASTGTTP